MGFEELSNLLKSILPGETVSIWSHEGKYYTGPTAPDAAMWIGDFESGDTVDFVLEIEKSVKEIHGI